MNAVFTRFDAGSGARGATHGRAFYFKLATGLLAAAIILGGAYAGSSMISADLETSYRRAGTVTPVLAPEHASAMQQVVLSSRCYLLTDVKKNICRARIKP